MSKHFLENFPRFVQYSSSLVEANSLRILPCTSGALFYYSVESVLDMPVAAGRSGGLRGVAAGRSGGLRGVTAGTNGG